MVDRVNSNTQLRWQATVDAAMPSKSRSKATVSQEQVATKVGDFMRYFDDQLQNLGQQLGLDPREARSLQDAGSKAMADIVNATFGTAAQAAMDTRGNMSKQATDVAVQTANSVAQKKLMELQDSFRGVDTTPQLTPFRTSSGQIRYNVIKPAPTIENLVLKGGGGKGVGYPPSLIELQKAGALSGLKQVIGTSAGALTALALASGVSAQEFQKIADETDTAALKKKPDGWDIKYPNITFKRGLHHGGAALERLDEISVRSVKDFLDQQSDAVSRAEGLGTITKGEADRLRALGKQDIGRDRTDQMITFRDLTILSKIDPGKFKALTLAGWNQTDKALQYFNSQTTPDMPIALAGRISMSLPYYFSSVKYDTGSGEDAKTWVDGGLGANLASGAVFDDLQESVDLAQSELDRANGDEARTAATLKLEEAERRLGQAHERTVQMTFDRGGRAYATLHDPAKAPRRPGLLARLKGRILGNPGLPGVVTADRERARNSGPNTMIVFHGKLGTLDLKPSQADKAAAALTARMRMLEQIAARQNQATYDIFDTAARAAGSLSPTERAEVLEAGRPIREQFGDDGLFRAAEDFFNEVQALHDPAPAPVPNELLIKV